MESKYELIITVCSGGNTDIVMDAARAAGAAGGTVIHAKGTAASAKKFFGLTIAEEKEMVFIVSSTKNKKDIMRSIIQNAGSNTEANSLVFSLPVNDTAGFKLMDDDSEDE